MASMFDPMRYSGPTSRDGTSREKQEQDLLHIGPPTGRRRKGRCCKEEKNNISITNGYVEEEEEARITVCKKPVLHLPVKCIE